MRSWRKSGTRMSSKICRIFSTAKHRNARVGVRSEKGPRFIFVHYVTRAIVSLVRWVVRNFERNLELWDV